MIDPTRMLRASSEMCQSGQRSLVSRKSNSANTMSSVPMTITADKADQVVRPHHGTPPTLVRATDSAP